MRSGAAAVAKWRADFPALAQTVHGQPLVYLDNAATAQKPKVVIDAVTNVYLERGGNIHRGVHLLSARATEAYEGARETLARFLGAASYEEIVFVRGTTEAINLVARSFVRPKLAPGDEIVVTWLEHHSNIVPWQIVAEEAGARVRPVAIDDRGDLDLDDLDAALASPRAKFLSVTHISNAIGTVNPIAEIVRRARERGVPVLVDGAQAVPHFPVHVGELGADFYAFSSHKVYGPSGVGVLWGQKSHLTAMPPFQGGGDMIRSVSFDGTRYAPPPARFEAGTPAIEAAVGLEAAVRYLDRLDRAAVAAHEHDLLTAAVAGLEALPGVTVIGHPRERAAGVSFVVEGVHPHDLGTLLDRAGIAIRAGHHCAQPLLEKLGVGATARASFALYNTRDEVAKLIAGVRRAREMFAG